MPCTHMSVPAGIPKVACYVCVCVCVCHRFKWFHADVPNGTYWTGADRHLQEFASYYHVRDTHTHTHTQTATYMRAHVHQITADKEQRHSVCTHTYTHTRARARTLQPSCCTGAGARTRAMPCTDACTPSMCFFVCVCVCVYVCVQLPVLSIKACCWQLMAQGAFNAHYLGCLVCALHGL